MRGHPSIVEIFCYLVCVSWSRLGDSTRLARPVICQDQSQYQEQYGIANDGLDSLYLDTYNL